jgi:hypothetical protein
MAFDLFTSLFAMGVHFTLVLAAMLFMSHSARCLERFFKPRIGP